jgi:hypothetical protein
MSHIFGGGAIHTLSQKFQKRKTNLLRHFQKKYSSKYLGFEVFTFNRGGWFVYLFHNKGIIKAVF